VWHEVVHLALSARLATGHCRAGSTKVWRCRLRRVRVSQVRCGCCWRPTGVHRSPLTDPGAIEILNDPLPLFAPVSVNTSPSALEEQPHEKPREEKPQQRCECHGSTRARFGNSIDRSRGSMIVAQQPHVAALAHVRAGVQFEDIRVPRLVAALAAGTLRSTPQSTQPCVQLTRACLPDPTCSPAWPTPNVRAVNWCCCLS
jgi:hypothetical protein